MRGGDFVLRLAEGLERPEQTLRDYVVTPQLAKCFDEALSLVRDALEGKTSKACYLVGSFGSGKSHFMAVLNLLLQPNATAREIAEKRLLKPKSEAAKAEIDVAFAQTMAVQKNIRDILLTDEGNPEMFRKLYPFSPALVETLVVMSFALQRERTALRVMLQILVEQKNRLKLGDIVPAGDIFDVISEGTDAVSDVVKRDFEKAKRLYEQKLRPVLEQQHKMRAEQAQAEDNDGNRRRKIREVLFEEFGLPKEEAQQLIYRYRFRWRGTDRECELQYANVREQPFDTFKNKAEQWRVIIDFPFDQAPHGPRREISRLQQFRNENEDGFRTLVWIPSFLNHDGSAAAGITALNFARK